MKKTPLFLLVILFTLLAKNSLAQAFSLEEAKDYAISNSLSVTEANNAIEIARLKIAEIRGMGLPQVSLNGSFNHFINLPVSVLDAKFFNPNAADGEIISFEAGTKYTSTGAMQVNQILFNGSYIVGLQTAKLFSKLQQDVSNQSKETVVFNVIQAYQLAIISKENKQFIDSLVLISQKLVEQQQNYLDLGLITQEELDQLKYSFLNAKTMSSSADMQMQNTLAMLKLAMGYPMNDPIEVSNTINELLNKESISKGNDVHTNLSYSILEKQITLFSLNLKNNKFANLPSLNAFFQQSYNAYRNDFGLFNNEKWFSQTLWGLSLNVPVFSGFSRQSKTAQAKIELMDKENQLTQLEQHLLFQELQLRNNVNSAEEKLYLQKENVALASSIYSNSITKQVIGIGNSLEVTQKHSQLMMAQTAYIGSLVDVFNARLAIDKLYNNLLQNK